MDTQQLENQILDLQKQVSDLQNQVQNLSRSSSFPREIETAIRERLGSFTGLTGTGTIPSGTLQFIYNGKTYNILIT